jgi:hypothetical protein
MFMAHTWGRTTNAGPLNSFPMMCKNRACYFVTLSAGADGSLPNPAATCPSRGQFSATANTAHKRNLNPVLGMF